MTQSIDQTQPLAPGEPTRQRLMDAAESLFAEKGYDATSIRDITTEAVCNVAAVNYHFSGKEGLYQEMFRRILVDMREKRVAAIENVISHPPVNIEKIIRAFSEVFIEPLVKDQSKGRRMMQLFQYEMQSHRLESGLFYEEMAKPVQTIMIQAIQMVYTTIDKEKTLLCIHSLVGQLIHAIQVHKLIEDDPAYHLPPLDLTVTVDHIVRFTIAGIKGYIKEGQS